MQFRPLCIVVVSILDKYRSYGEEASRKTEALRKDHPAFSVRLKNIHADWTSLCTRNAVNVFDIGLTPPDRSDVSLAAATPCRLQLCAMLGSSIRNLPAKLVPAHPIKVYGGSGGTFSLFTSGERSTRAN